MRELPSTPPAGLSIRYAKVIPPAADGTHPVVIVDRVSPLGIQPDYCVHGTVQCRRCETWCNLGTETHDAVLNGVDPICQQCAEAIWRDLQARGIEPPKLTAHLNDHRRADGPHE